MGWLDMSCWLFTNVKRDEARTIIDIMQTSISDVDNFDTTGSLSSSVTPNQRQPPISSTTIGESNTDVTRAKQNEHRHSLHYYGNATGLDFKDQVRQQRQQRQQQEKRSRHDQPKIRCQQEEILGAFFRRNKVEPIHSSPALSTTTSSIEDAIVQLPPSPLEQRHQVVVEAVMVDSSIVHAVAIPMNSNHERGRRRGGCGCIIS